MQHGRYAVIPNRKDLGEYSLDMVLSKRLFISRAKNTGFGIQMSLAEYDDLDKRIIELLSTSSQGSYRQIAKQLNVHPTTLIQRVKNLESKGVIKGYRASIDYMALGFDYMGLVNVYADNVATVQDAIGSIPQVISVFDVTGDADCVAWIACVDRDEFSDVVKSINAIPNVKKTNTAVILGIKKDPFSYIPPIIDME